MWLKIEDLIGLGEEVEGTRRAANGLWVWLPSYTVTRRHHPDHFMSFAPSMRNVMHEAVRYFACMKRASEGEAEPMSEEDRAIFGTCACGNGCEEHDGGI